MNSERKAFILMLMWGMGGTALSAVPVLTVDNTNADFGTYPANQAKEHVFTLKNTGDQPLKIINIRTTCGCSETRLDKDELAPGSTAKLTAVIKAGSIAGPYSKNVFVESNDPKQRFLMLLFNGNAIPLVTVKPQDKIYAGTLPVNQQWKQEFLLDATQSGVVFGNAEIRGMSGADATLVPVGKQQFKLAVTLKASSKPGVFNLQVLLPVKNPTGWKPVEIMISGRHIARK